MKTLFFWLLVTATAFSQQKTEWLDKHFSKTEEADHAYKRITTGIADSPERYQVKTWAKSGELFSEGVSIKYNYPFYDGVYTEYFPSGQISSTEEFRDGKPNGLFEHFYPNGKKKRSATQKTTPEKYADLVITDAWLEDGTQVVKDGEGDYTDVTNNLEEKGRLSAGRRNGLWRGKIAEKRLSFEEMYDGGKFIWGKSTDETGTESHYTEFETKPVPPGSIEAFYKYISKNFKYPRRSKDSGRIVVGFVVDTDGKIVELRIVKSVSEELDAEAIRVLAASEPWQPARQRGQKVRCSYLLPITLGASR